MSNTELWDKLGKTDPAHTKQFTRAGGFKGTAIKPMWSYRRMTEEFGPCGKGWGIDQPSFQVVPDPGTGDILVYCTVSVWHGNVSQKVYGVGGDKVAGKNRNGPVSDDEAFKKAFTDGVTNALKMIGVGADVHMGMFDDNKYVNTMAEEFQEKKSSAALKRDDAWTKALTDIEADMVDVKSVVGLEELQRAYRSKAAKDGWTEAWKTALADVFIGYRNQMHEDNLWAELTAITSLRGLKSFWDDHQADVRVLGPAVLKKFTAKKDEMKMIFDANASTLNAL